MTPILPLWAAIILIAIWIVACSILVAIAIGKAIKYLRGPEFINDDCMLDDTAYCPPEDFVC